MAYLAIFDETVEQAILGAGVTIQGLFKDVVEVICEHPYPGSRSPTRRLRLEPEEGYGCHFDSALLFFQVSDDPQVVLFTKIAFIL